MFPIQYRLLKIFHKKYDSYFLRNYPARDIFTLLRSHSFSLNMRLGKVKV